ncbi:opine metallophore biosynthesis dehydrogenase, partial [Staphylococcus warneri]|uniref:opine metallophore biosynthesis dehydrogenase n=1 Tax=Staphylococcus warneri TaxID=1292 RepID=UPI00119EABF9
PHKHPPYFHFSPLPFNSLYQNQQPLLHIPTIPTQHYYPTTLIQPIPKPLPLSTPIIHTLLHPYLPYSQPYQIHHPQQSLSSQFNLHHFQLHLSLLTT